MMEHSMIVSLPMDKTLFFPASIEVFDLEDSFRKVRDRALSRTVKENYDRCLRLVSLAINYNVKKIELSNSRGSLIFYLRFARESDLNNFNKSLSSTSI